MRRLSVVLGLVVVLLVGSIGMAGAITNGQPDGDDHPYVGLLVFDAAPGVPAWRCSGALIAPNVVLTAGHCTDGAVAARVWFQEDVTYDAVPFPLYPYGGPGSGAIEGTAYTNPMYRSPDNPYGGGNGLPAFSYRDVGIVVLNEPVVDKGFASLPTPGLVDTLRNKTAVDYVGYGVQEQLKGGGPPVWTGLRVRLYAPGELVSGKFVHSPEYLRLSLNPGGGSGGTCFGDSGGPNFIGTSNVLAGVTSFGLNSTCGGTGGVYRVDRADDLDWLYEEFGDHLP